MTGFKINFVLPLLLLKKTLLKAANGEDFQSYIEQLEKSHYKDDIDLSDLKRHLLVLPDIIKKQLPQVKKVALISTICDAMENQAFKELVPTIHRLLRLYIAKEFVCVSENRIKYFGNF